MSRTSLGYGVAGDEAEAHDGVHEFHQLGQVLALLYRPHIGTNLAGLLVKAQSALRWFFNRSAEHDFVGKERCPFLGGGEITFGSADQFVPAICPTDEPCVAEAGDDFSFVDDALSEVFYFHSRPH